MKRTEKQKAYDFNRLGYLSKRLVDDMDRFFKVSNAVLLDLVSDNVKLRKQIKKLKAVKK